MGGRRAEASPPPWVERALRLVLRPHDRDVITSDLLEEYLDNYHGHGLEHARRTYVAQVLSIVLVETRRRIAPTYLLIGTWAALFCGLLRIRQPPPPAVVKTIPLAPQLFWLTTTLLLVAIVAGTFLVSGWLYFVQFTQRRTSSRRFPC
jgi:hypothetical protein